MCGIECEPAMFPKHLTTCDFEKNPFEYDPFEAITNWTKKILKIIKSLPKSLFYWKFLEWV